eukprot:403356830
MSQVSKPLSSVNFQTPKKAFEQSSCKFNTQKSQNHQQVHKPEKENLIINNPLKFNQYEKVETPLNQSLDEGISQRKNKNLEVIMYSSIRQASKKKRDTDSKYIEKLNCNSVVKSLSQDKDLFQFRKCLDNEGNINQYSKIKESFKSPYYDSDQDSLEKVGKKDQDNEIKCKLVFQEIENMPYLKNKQCRPQKSFVEDPIQNSIKKAADLLKKRYFQKQSNNNDDYTPTNYENIQQFNYASALQTDSSQVFDLKFSNVNRFTLSPHPQFRNQNNLNIKQSILGDYSIKKGLQSNRESFNEIGSKLRRRDRSLLHSRAKQNSERMSQVSVRSYKYSEDEKSVDSRINKEENFLNFIKIAKEASKLQSERKQPNLFKISKDLLLKQSQNHYDNSKELLTQEIKKSFILSPQLSTSRFSVDSQDQNSKVILLAEKMREIKNLIPLDSSLKKQTSALNQNQQLNRESKTTDGPISNKQNRNSQAKLSLRSFLNPIQQTNANQRNIKTIQIDFNSSTDSVSKSKDKEYSNKNKSVNLKSVMNIQEQSMNNEEIFSQNDTKTNLKIDIDAVNQQDKDDIQVQPSHRSNFSYRFQFYKPQLEESQNRQAITTSNTPCNKYIQGKQSQNQLPCSTKNNDSKTLLNLLRSSSLKKSVQGGHFLNSSQISTKSSNYHSPYPNKSILQTSTRSLISFQDTSRKNQPASKNQVLSMNQQYQTCNRGSKPIQFTKLTIPKPKKTAQQDQYYQSQKNLKKAPCKTNANNSILSKENNSLQKSLQKIKNEILFNKKLQAVNSSVNTPKEKQVFGIQNFN